MPEKSIRSNWWDEPAARQVLELQGWDSRWPFRLRRSSPRRLPRFLFLPALSRHTTQYRCCWHVQKQRIQKSATQHRDRKSTRLNSSHGYISYAVFCLKKKKIKKRTHT